VNATSARFPEIRLVFSHSDEALTVLAARMIDDFPKNHADRAPKGVS